MLSLWSVRRALRDSARQIETALHRDGADRLIVRSGIGAGRHTLANDLAEQLGAHVVEFPSYDDLDSPLHGLVQLATAAGPLGVLGADRAALLARALEGAGALADAKRPLVLLIPAPIGPGSDTDVATPAEIDGIVRSVGAVPRLRVIVLATTAHRGEWFEAPATVTLTAPRVGPADLDPQQLPDRFAHAASDLQRWMSATGWASTPIEARLQVGLVAMGDRPAALALRLEALARRMAAQLTTRFTTIGPAVRRLLVARRPLPTATVAAISGIERDWLPLLTACIGYGEHRGSTPALGAARGFERAERRARARVRSDAIVLGSDLPTTSPGGHLLPGGWNTVMTRHPGLGAHAGLKIRHHGSPAAFHAALMTSGAGRAWWISPFNRGKRLPPTSPDGIPRLVALNGEVSLTAAPRRRDQQPRHPDPGVVPLAELPALFTPPSSTAAGALLITPPALAPLEPLWCGAFDDQGAMRGAWRGECAFTVVG